MGRLAALLLGLALFTPPAPQAVALRITVTVTGADGATHPVPRHALLISDEPATSAPRRYVTTTDGTVQAYVKPGHYVVESDTPFLFEGKAYEWTQMVTVAATGQTTLALTSANATIDSGKSGGPGSPGAAEAGAASSEAALLAAWEGSVFTIWTPRAVGRGFLVDERGLIATNQRLVGKDVDVEVQVSAAKKIPGRVVASDVSRNVAIVWIDPRAAAPAKAMPLGYAQADNVTVRERDKVYSIEGRPGRIKSLASGQVERVNPRVVTSDVLLRREDSGAPLLTASGAVIAITTASDEPSVADVLSPQSVRIDDAKNAIAQAQKNVETAPAPPATLLPVDPDRPIPEDALKSATRARAGTPTAYLITGSEFDVNIITSPVLYAWNHKPENLDRFDYGRDDRSAPLFRPLDDFGAWKDYVTEFLPVVFVRVSPKFGEKFWTTVARSAAQTQGVLIPAIKKPKAAFGGVRVTCGASDVPPIHRFRIEHRVDDGTSVDEGLYVFPPSAISPACGGVKITVFSDKPQDKGDTRTLEPAIVQRVRDDFAGVRQLP